MKTKIVYRVYIIITKYSKGNIDNQKDQKLYETTEGTLCLGYEDFPPTIISVMGCCQRCFSLADVSKFKVLTNFRYDLMPRVAC